MTRASSSRRLALAGLTILLIPALTSAEPTTSPSNIEWSIERDGSLADGKVQMTIESRWGAGNHSMWSNDRAISDLHGLTAAQLTGPSNPVRFAIEADAGRLDCGGTAGGLTGRGSCSFSVDPRFASYLQQRGMGSPTPHQAFTLTMSGVGRDLIDSMQEIGYARPTFDQLAGMGIHGVSAEFVRGLARSGYRLRSADDLVSMRIHGVTPAYVRDIAAIGPQFANLTAEDLVSFSIHGARPELVRAYARFTRGELKADDVVSMAIHGVTASYLNQLSDLGYRDLTADDLVSMRIHGVTPDYVHRLQQNGMKHVSADQLVRLRLAGFEPEK